MAAIKNADARSNFLSISVFLFVGAVAHTRSSLSLRTYGPRRTPLVCVLLYQLQHDAGMLSLDQLFGMAAVGDIEDDVARLAVIDSLLAVGRGGGDIAVMQIDHHHLGIVE